MLVSVCLAQPLSTNEIMLLIFPCIVDVPMFPAVCLLSLFKQEKISLLNPNDFVLSIGGPEPTEPFEEDGVEARTATLASFPTLEDQGIAMAIVNIDACSINLPHVHPRATEVKGIMVG